MICSIFISEQIETIRKENFFSEEVTESEQEIIQKRVALQQRQFKEFERRERARKSKKITAIYDYLTAEEMGEMLEDCKDDEVVIGLFLIFQSYYLFCCVFIGRGDCSFDTR